MEETQEYYKQQNFNCYFTTSNYSQKFKVSNLK